MNNKKFLFYAPTSVQAVLLYKPVAERYQAQYLVALVDQAFWSFLWFLQKAGEYRLGTISKQPRRALLPQAHVSHVDNWPKPGNPTFFTCNVLFCILKTYPNFRAATEKENYIMFTHFMYPYKSVNDAMTILVRKTIF